MKSYKFIVNPIAGGGRAIKLVPRIKDIFTQAKAEFDFEITSGPGDAMEMAARALEKGFDIIVAVGGNGTVALRVNTGVKPFKGVSVYIYAFFLTLFSYKQVKMEIDLGNGPEEINPLLVAVGIGQNYGGGMKILLFAIQDDGLFDVCILDWMDKISLAYNLPKVFISSHVKMKQVTMNRSEKATLKIDTPLPLHMEDKILFGNVMNSTIEHGGMPVLIGGANE
ncbi:MAG: diacylglycerol kinase family protein [Bacillota bacterium]|nr:diacylglycerol kinase family protein [Bacillota bacterium]